MGTTSGTRLSKASGMKSVRKVVFAVLRLAIGIGILVYLAKSGRVEPHSLTRVFRAWPLTLLGMTVLLIDILFMSIRVSLFDAQRLSLSLGNAIQLTSDFSSRRFCPERLGRSREAFTTPHGKMRGGAQRLLFDRFIGLFSLELIPFLLGPFFVELLRGEPTLRQIL